MEHPPDKYQFTPAEESRPPAKNKTQWCMGISLVVLSVTVLVAVAALIWQNISLADRFGNITVTCQPADVIQRYPGYFRTPEQQAQVENIGRASIKPFTVPNLNCTNYSRRPQRDVTRSRRQANVDDPTDRPVYHGCCKSNTNWVKPDTATNQVGETVEVVQFPNHNQYFQQESCETVPGCSICTCAQPDPFLVTAIVYKDKNAPSPVDKYEETIIQFPGCCKCLNIALT